MRKLILQMQISTDGCVSSTNPNMPWQLWNWGPEWTWDTELQAEFNKTLTAVDTILLSRKMLEQGYLDHWSRIADLAETDNRYAFAQCIVEAEKIVISDKTVANHWPKTAVMPRPMYEAIATLMQQRGGDIICFGGVGFGSALLTEGLADEVQLYVNPATVGEGERIFADVTHGQGYNLISMQPYDCGIVICRYQPRR